MKTVGLWSGGKDSCLACYKAIAGGHQVLRLVNFTQPDGEGSLSHGLSAEIISKQVGLTGIPLIQKAIPQGSYEKEFKSLIAQLKKDLGITGIVFGDIYVKEHKDWIDRVCKEMDIEPILPLWELDTKKIISDFIDRGFQTIVVCVKHDVLGNEWLGRKIDRKFIEDLGKLNPRIDPCGESGEFHTLVVSGPMFKGSIEIVSSGTKEEDGRGFFDIKEFRAHTKK
ncbi:MAG: diphthine--ammonia ligase [Candidatus Omnitrophica bacterium]|nr:diphthine--ammonia ligase [Candidatus Omnitrophota bacterium]